MARPWHSPLPSCHGPARATGPHCPRLSPQRVVKSSHLHHPPPQPSGRWRVGCTACGARTRRATCTHVQGGLTWAAHTRRQRSAQAALAVGSTHHGPCTLMGSAQRGQYTHTHTDGAHHRLCTHTGSTWHVPHAVVDTAALDSVSFHCSPWYACHWFMSSLALLGKDGLMSLVCVTSASGLWWRGPGEGRSGWPAESGSMPPRTGSAAASGEKRRQLQTRWR